MGTVGSASPNVRLSFDGAPPAVLCACRQGEAAYVREDGTAACLRCARADLLPGVVAHPPWGVRYGELVVVGRASRALGPRYAWWWLRCGCGALDAYRADRVVARAYVTCGAGECRARRFALQRRAAA